MTVQSLKFYLTHPVTAFRRVLLAIYEYRHPDEPWFSQGAVRKLEELLTKDMKVFEWGSGRSTLWLSKRSKEVVSIEYSEVWSQKVQEMIVESQTKNVNLKYIALDHDKSLPTPKDYDPIPKYVSEIFNYPKESFDLVIVDGHYRLTCVDQCLDYISPGGYILIDNSNRIPREEWVVPMSWPMIHQSENVMTQTTLWQKPKN
ncbi:MAG: class I SAM-dependent methyltransferase [Bdellovibrionales bacterium]|nr:class I SAM-dependent methyltransferase [Bdellovibrionales bacterium]